ncbi:TlpA family protein disulfide reductase [Pseudoalteromonas neustonica]|uniref:TlpA family protein disulfide reductase n=1 Tax=Pseudoalteromonas neustonica TaxID=1840331 RepID=UPI0007DAFEAE|nr:hypothetical protein [Pseudoalteromonas neustonica]
MLKNLLMLCTLVCLSWSASASDEAPFSGDISASTLLADYNKFSQEYERFTATSDELELIQKLAGKDILVLFGTWCHDSQREVPRLLKLLEKSKVAVNSLQLIAVGYNKKDPAGVAPAHELKYTATMIVMQEGKELSRVVEKPKNSLVIDLTNFDEE